MSSDDGELIFQYNTYNNTDRNEWVPSDSDEEQVLTERSKPLRVPKRGRPKKPQSPTQYMQIKDENHIYDRKYTQKELKKQLVFYHHVTHQKNEEIKHLERKLEEERKANEILTMKLKEAMELAPQLYEE